jgi:hypothetical protein
MSFNAAPFCTDGIVWGIGKIAVQEPSSVWLTLRGDLAVPITITSIVVT